MRRQLFHSGLAAAAVVGAAGLTGCSGEQVALGATAGVLAGVALGSLDDGCDSVYVYHDYGYRRHGYGYGLGYRADCEFGNGYRHSDWRGRGWSSGGYGSHGGWGRHYHSYRGRCDY